MAGKRRKRKTGLIIFTVVGIAIIAFLCSMLVKTAMKPNPIVDQWVIDETGTSYVDENGEPVTGWVKLTADGETPNIEDWCYFDENGKYVDCFEESQADMTGVFVDISKQHLYHFTDGKMDLSANIISGTKDESDTPPGEYSVYNKKKDTHITGPDWDYDIACWIGFIGTEYGFHDAWWKDDSLFDDPTTYYTNGSHGCVNLRQDDILKLFDMVEVGTKVVIHK